jgi:hypothetical protein
MDEIFKRHEFAMEFLNRLEIKFDHMAYMKEVGANYYDDIAEFLGKQAIESFQRVISQIKEDWVNAFRYNYLTIREEVWSAGGFDESERGRFVVLFDEAHTKTTPMMSMKTLLAYIKERL